MTAREQLWYLIDGIHNKEYDTNTFCDEFVRIYCHETDKDSLTEDERIEFKDLFDMAARFSDYEEDLLIPNAFFSEKDILEKVESIRGKLHSTMQHENS